jgi:hypothetical protein
MVEPLPSVVDRQEDTADYKPLALLSVVAFANSVLFTTIVVILTLVGLFSRRPVLEQWIIPFAFSGVLLAIAARWQIHLSEGTREGRRLTNIAWWLSLIGGAVYAAYFYGNVMAIQNQARQFVAEAFLKKLKEGKIEEAYLATIEPGMRKGMTNLRDVERRFGNVTEPFRAEKLPQLIDRSNGIIEIEDYGVADWRTSPDGLEVATRCVVRTPEGAFEVLIPLVGLEDRETGVREWYIKRGMGVKPIGMTTYGMLMGGLQQEADNFMVTWLNLKRMPGRYAEMYLDTVAKTNDERKRELADFYLKYQILPTLAELINVPTPLPTSLKAAATLNTIEGMARLTYPSVRELSRRLVRWDESKQAHDAAVKEQMVPRMLLPEHTNLAMSVAMQDPSRTRMQLFPDHVRASINLDVVLPPPLRYRCKGRLVAVCEDKDIVAELNSRKDKLKQSADIAEVQTMLNTMRHTWRIAEVTIDLARDMGDQRPGGGAPALMPAVERARPR